MEKQTDDQERTGDKESLWTPLADWEWDEKEEEYDMALRRIELFELQSGPVLHSFQEGAKSTIRRDPQGSLQELREPMSPEEKKDIDDAYEIVRAFEALKAKDLGDMRRYAEAFREEAVEQERQGDVTGSVSPDETIKVSNPEIQALRDMSDIRQATHESGHSRIAGFEQGDIDRDGDMEY